MFRKAFDDSKVIKDIYSSDRLKRYSLFFLGVLIEAIAFNVFILPSDMVFGVSGISVVLNQLFGLNPSYVILLANLLLIVISFVYLGNNSTNKTIVGSILYPLLIEFTMFLPNVIDLGETEPVIIALSGAFLYGIGCGLVFKTGYTTGGSDVLKQILSQYGKKSMGQATLYVEGIIVTLCLFVFGWQSFIYSIISLYIISVLTDKVVIGVSRYKTFQIVTDREKEIKQFIVNQLCGAVILDSRVRYIGDRKKVIVCVIPTKRYFLLKRGILQIDKNAFFIVTDTYEVNCKNGKKDDLWS